jgi:hypothetical protein
MREKDNYFWTTKPKRILFYKQHERLRALYYYKSISLRAMP